MTVPSLLLAGFYSEGLMTRFGSEAEGRIQEFSQQNLSNMAWAFGKLSHDAPALLDAIGRKAMAIVQVTHMNILPCLTPLEARPLT